MNELLKVSGRIFAKGNALGNDFVLLHQNHELDANTVRAIGHRKLGIGCDQLLRIDDDLNVSIWNDDGSTAKMCGNGLRCFAKWLFMNDCPILQDKNIENYVELKTVSGIVKLEKHGEEIKMQFPNHAKIEKSDDVFFVNVGNPHKIHILPHAPEMLSKFADNLHNTSCIWKEQGIWRARTWELGANETLACGSAAYAIASVLDSINETDLDIHFQLGQIKHIKKDGLITQIGPGSIVAVGNFA